MKTIQGMTIGLLLSLQIFAEIFQTLFYQLNSGSLSTNDTVKTPFEKITSGCLLVGREVNKRVINSEEEEDNTLRKSPSPHPGCSIYSPPYTDFKTRTLILFTVEIGECCQHRYANNDSLCICNG